MPTAASPSLYEIQCECGQTMTVTAGQAGSQVLCECGKSVDVPTIRELRRQAVVHGGSAGPATAKFDARTAQESYSRAALSVAAIGLILGGLLIAGSFFFYQRQVKDQVLDPRYMKLIKDQTEKMDEIPPAFLWEEWSFARENGLGEHHAWAPVLNKQRAESARYGLYFGAGASGLGVLLMICALMLPRRARAKA
jgi:hypothetical protein